MTGLFKGLDRKAVELEVEEELRLHLDMIRRDLLKEGLSSEKAEEAARKRFGDMEPIRNQCVAISRRSRPLIRALKSILIFVNLFGFFMRVFNTDLYLRQVGIMLVVVSSLSYLWLYARGLSWSAFPLKNRTSSFQDGSLMLIASYRETKRDL